jgi:death-on-curing protein
MEEPDGGQSFFLSAAEVIALHAHIFGISDEQAADRLRSYSVLAGAVGRPRQHAHYGGADLALQAAVLAHGIAEGQPFFDGNKRTALVALLTFLAINGTTTLASDGELAFQIYNLAHGTTAAPLADWLRPTLAARSPD